MSNISNLCINIQDRSFNESELKLLNLLSYRVNKKIELQRDICKWNKWKKEKATVILEEGYLLDFHENGEQNSFFYEYKDEGTAPINKIQVITNNELVKNDTMWFTSFDNEELYNPENFTPEINFGDSSFIQNISFLSFLVKNNTDTIKKALDIGELMVEIRELGFKENFNSTEGAIKYFNTEITNMFLSNYISNDEGIRENQNRIKEIIEEGEYDLDHREFRGSWLYNFFLYVKAKQEYNFEFIPKLQK